MQCLRLLVSLALLAVVPPLQNLVPAQSSPIDIALASQYFQEARTLCSRDNGKLWGVSLCAPILFVDRKTRTIVANQADREGVLIKDGNVFVGKLPAKVNIANTAIEWAGVKWTMIIFPLPEDKYRRANLMAHEMWHRIQDEIGFPSSGAANNHLDSRDGRVWLQLEWRALASALSSRGRQRRQAIADALLFRAYRKVGWDNEKWGPGYRTQRPVKGQPSCPDCKGRLISSVVNFGDPLPEKELMIAAEHARACNLMLVLGSSLVMNPAASLVGLAIGKGTRVVLINQGETTYDEVVTLRSREGIGEILPPTVQSVRRVLTEHSRTP